MRNLLLGVLLGAALGFAGHLILSERSGADDLDRAPGVTRDAGLREATSARRNVEVPAIEERRAEATGSPIRAAIEALRPPPASIGEGVITGRIRDEAGAGIEGVALTAMPSGFRATPAPEAGEEELEDWVRRTVASEARRRQVQRLAASDAQGEFTITGLDEGVDYDVTPRLRGWRLHRRGSGAQRTRAGDRIEFVATRVGLLTVKVEFPDGTAPTKADILMQQTHSVYSLNWGPPTTEFTCDPGPVQLAASTPGFRSTLERVDLSNGPGEVTLRLAPCPRLSGRVVFPGPRPESLEIRAALLEEDEVPDEALLLSRGELTWTHANSDFRFEVERVVEGRYALQGFDQRSQPLTEMRIVETATGTPAVIELPGLPVDSRTQTVLRVVDAEGKTVTGNRIEVVRVTGEDRKRRWVRSPPDGEGRVWIDRREDLTAPDGTGFFVHVESLAHGAVMWPLPLEAREVEVRFQAPAWLDVTLEDAPRTVVSRLELSVRGPDAAAEPPTTQLAIPEARGERRRIGPLQPGPSFVSVFDEFTLLYERALDLFPGENTLRLPIPALHRLEVRTSLTDGTFLSLESLGLPGRLRARRQSQVLGGRVDFPLLPPGRYRLSAVGLTDGPEALELEIPRVRQIEFGGR
ncbi:MAG: hypothetical protein R3F20_06845 [Planctomycetota bacterium]